MLSRTIVLSLAFGFLSGSLCLRGERPQVLFIAIDDLNDWLGCLQGHPQAHTPHLDELAARGVLFTNAHCASPACQPSRAAVFTGMRPSQTGVWSNRSKPLSKLQPDAILIPNLFSQAGYHTLGTGKLLHDRAVSAFDDYFTVEQRWSPLSRAATDYTKDSLPSKGTNNPRHLVRDSTDREVVLPLNRMPSDRAPEKKSAESFDWGPWNVPDRDFGDSQITDWSIAQLKKKYDSPLFLALGYYRPHIPLWAPARFFERFQDEPGILPPTLENDLDDLSETGKHWAIYPDTAGLHSTVLQHQQWQTAVEAYLACVTYIDSEIGRLIRALDESSHADNTIIVVWSDHGWHLGEKDHWGKWTGWERSTRVPLIIVPPKNQTARFAAPGARCKQPVSLLDLFPTLVDWCQLEPAPHLAGSSLLPLLRQPSTETKRHILTSFDEDNYTIRSLHWRYIRYSDGSEELYDHRNDPHEWHNLAHKPESRQRLEDFRDQLP